jgi:hypothetical protein
MGASHGLSGDERDRTANPGLAKPVLSQLSYVPGGGFPISDFRFGISERIGRRA